VDGPVKKAQNSAKRVFNRGNRAYLETTRYAIVVEVLGESPHGLQHFSFQF
jgi:hypothetical protein